MSAVTAVKRSAQACNRCRQQKMKCNGGPGPCDRCTRARQPCIFENAQHSTLKPVSPPINSSVVLTPLSAGLDQGHREKRLRLGPDSVPTVQPTSHLLGIQDSEIPYTVVRNLEHQRLPEDQSENEQPPSPFAPSIVSGPSPQTSSDKTFLAHLCETGIAPSEAEQMFQIFGDRIAPFIPTLFDTDFSRLPTSPILGLAAVHSIARYLPGSSSLRARVWQQLSGCLRDLVFATPDGLSPMTAETMQGLVILYGCCEASSPSDHTTEDFNGLDMLSARSLAEGYAVKLGVGSLKDPTPHNSFLFVWWLWLYTIGHHCAILHSCARTMWAVSGIAQAKAYVEENFQDTRIQRLIGEVELCMLWERLQSVPSGSTEQVDHELSVWVDSWSELINKDEGRQLLFHYRFMQFQLYASVALAGDDFSLQSSSSHVEVAQAFLHCLTRLSPIAKDRLRYMCDFGFVMISYACLFILRATKSPFNANWKAELVGDVSEAAALMLSFSAKKSDRPAIYGYALEKLCQGEGWDARSKQGNFARQQVRNTSTFPPNNPTTPLGIPQMAPIHSAFTPPQSAHAPSMTSETPNINLASEFVSEASVPRDHVSSGELEAAQSIAELWSHNSNFFAFDGIYITH
ncbi:hypothetical protein IQ07DRAFT_634756 [Pyrenochaeta sp. DS3sAY3a]|nr:hypothetical protein IQ07DRAFT_634756 [Pyrenochaeta sp. DS3sAY3a]